VFACADPGADGLILDFRHVGALRHQADASIFHRVERERCLREPDIDLLGHHLGEGGGIIPGRLRYETDPEMFCERQREHVRARPAGRDADGLAFGVLHAANG
jgi:hypothetical protein